MSASGHLFFSADGEQVIAGVYWEKPDVEPPADALGAQIRDARTGELVRTIDLGPCGGIVTAVSESRLLVRTPPGNPEGQPSCTFPFDGLAVQIIDLESGEPRLLSANAGLGFGATLSGDGRFAAFDDITDGTITSVVLDLESGERVFELDPFSVSAGQSISYARRLNYDGSLLLYGDRPILVYDIASGGSDPIARLGGQGGESNFAEFGPSGDTVYFTARDRSLSHWDAREGTELSVWPTIGNGRPSISDDGRMVLVADAESPKAVLLVTGARGETGSVPTCPGFVGATSLAVVGQLAAFGEVCDDQVEANGGTQVIGSRPANCSTTCTEMPDKR